jgi:hypothetical protein
VLHPLRSERPIGSWLQLIHSSGDSPVGILLHAARACKGSRPSWVPRRVVCTDNQQAV